MELKLNFYSLLSEGGFGITIKLGELSVLEWASVDWFMAPNDSVLRMIDGKIDLR